MTRSRPPRSCRSDRIRKALTSGADAIHARHLQKRSAQHPRFLRGGHPLELHDVGRPGTAHVSDRSINRLPPAPATRTAPNCSNRPGTSLSDRTLTAPCTPNGRSILPMVTISGEVVMPQRLLLWPPFPSRTASTVPSVEAASDRHRRLSALTQPGQHPFLLQLRESGFFQRIKNPQNFQKPPIARLPRIRRDHAIYRPLMSSCPRQSQMNGHCLSSFMIRLQQSAVGSVNSLYLRPR